MIGSLHRCGDPSLAATGEDEDRIVNIGHGPDVVVTAAEMVIEPPPGPAFGLSLDELVRVDAGMQSVDFTLGRTTNHRTRLPFPYQI